eukprot:4358022-Prymnesium_polylepis.3
MYCCDGAGTALRSSSATPVHRTNSLPRCLRADAVIDRLCARHTACRHPAQRSEPLGSVRYTRWADLATGKKSSKIN